MRYLLTFKLVLLTVGIVSAQDCQKFVLNKFIQKTEDPQQPGVTHYWGTGHINVSHPDEPGIISLMIGKSVSDKDTTYLISIVQDTPKTPDELNGVTLTFADGSVITKPDQPVEAGGSGNLYRLSVVSKLTKAEFLELGWKPLSEITLMQTWAEVPKSLAASIMTIVPCLLSI